MRVSRKVLTWGVCGAAVVATPVTVFCVVSSRNSEVETNRKRLLELYRDHSTDPFKEIEPTSMFFGQGLSRQDIFLATQSEIQDYDHWLEKTFFAKLTNKPNGVEKALENIKNNATKLSKITPEERKNTLMPWVRPTGHDVFF